MLRRTLSSLAVALCAAATIPLHAQTQGDGNNDADAATKTKLRSDLRNLVTAQEAYYADHSAYADIVDNLRYRPSAGSQVSLTATQNNAWGAVASDPSWPGKSCVIFVNLADKYRPKTAADKRVGENKDEGRPICDGDPPPEK